MRRRKFTPTPDHLEPKQLLSALGALLSPPVAPTQPAPPQYGAPLNQSPPLYPIPVCTDPVPDPEPDPGDDPRIAPPLVPVAPAPAPNPVGSFPPVSTVTTIC